MGRLKLSGDPRAQEFLDKFPSIRVKNFQELLLVTWNLFYSHENELHKKVASRARQERLPPIYINLLFSLKPEDVISILGCSRRTAFDYIQTLQALGMLMCP